MKEDPAVTIKPSFLKDIIKGGTEMTSASRRNEIDFSMSHCTVPPSNSMPQDSKHICPGSIQMMKLFAVPQFFYLLEGGSWCK